MLGRAWFWNRIARKYARDEIADQASYERKLAATRARLTPEAVVLELGCGTGTTAVYHAPVVAHIDAVDISSGMLEIARGRAAEAGVTNITFHEADVERFEAKPESYDMVMLHSVLHLLDDPAAMVTRAAGFLKPGGWLVTSTTSLAEDGLGTIRLVLMPLTLAGLRLTKFTSDELREMIRSAGLEIDEDWKPGPRKATFIVARKP